MFLLFCFLIRKEEVTCGAWIHSVPSDGLALALALADACSVLVPGHDRGWTHVNARLAACSLSSALLVFGGK